MSAAWQGRQGSPVLPRGDAVAARRGSGRLAWPAAAAVLLLASSACWVLVLVLVRAVLG